MEHPVAVAWCPLLFQCHGGEMTPQGRPIFRKGVPGRCDVAFDCGDCQILKDAVSAQVATGWVAGWECDKCLKDTRSSDETSGLGRTLPGYYHSGQCTRCSWDSHFLQLVLRRQK